MSFCIVCGEFEGTIEEVRKHQFNEHYEFYKLQCNDDPELIKSGQEECGN